jgi:malonyl-CoA O-methyltransferase
LYEFVPIERFALVWTSVNGTIASTASAVFENSLMELNLPQPDQIRQAFDRVASRYDQHAALEQEVGSRLLERLEYQRRPVQRILDLGCGTGLACAELKNKFRKAQVIGIDSSMAMLARQKKRSGMLRPLKTVCSDFSSLPLPERSVDLVFSNLAFQWCDDPTRLFTEIRRVLAPDGMLLFSSLGLGTLNELANAWHDADEAASMAGFVDILEHGDALMAAGFQQPVMDAERITLDYPDITALSNELEATGMASFLRNGNLKKSLEAVAKAYEPFKVNDRYPVSFEVVYGTAFGPQDGQPRKTSEGDVVTFSVDSLLKAKPKRS